MARPKPVDEGQRTDLHRRLVKRGHPWAVAQQALLDDPQKDAQRAVQRRPIALHEVTQPLGHRQHPLAHRQVRKNMVHQVRRRLLHAPRVARGADCATLAREGYRLVMRAVLAPHPRKTVGQDAALQVFAKCLFYIVPDRELPFPNGGMVFCWSEDFGRLAL